MTGSDLAYFPCNSRSILLNIRKSWLLSFSRFSFELPRPGYKKIATWEFSVGVSTMILPNFALEDQVTARNPIFVKAILFQCPFSFPLNSLAFMLGKERLRKDSWWWWEAVLMVWGMSKKCTQRALQLIRGGAGGLVFCCGEKNVRLLCIFKLVLQFSPKEIMCRGGGEIPSYVFLRRKTKQTLGVLGGIGERWMNYNSGESRF